jgi:cytochrome c oxidase subunit II
MPRGLLNKENGTVSERRFRELVKIKDVVLPMLVFILLALGGHVRAGAHSAAARIVGAPAFAEPQVIEITARKFEFVPAQITLKQGQPVILRVKSADVKHGFYQRELKIDAEIPANQTVDVPLTPGAAGTFSTKCDHFCGAGHGKMKMTIVVQ